MKHNIHILITVTKPEQRVASTLIFDTLRTGFPTSNVKVWNNFNDESVTVELRSKAKNLECEYESLPKKWHHAAWIRHLAQHNDEPFVVLDGDMIFYEDCEPFDYSLGAGQLLAGYYIPIIYNEWAQCVSYERLHTAYLMFLDPPTLRKAISQFYRYNGPYSPLDPFMPCVGVTRGTLMFWDTCSMLFNVVGGHPFSNDHRKRYAHVNSASFYTEVLERIDNKEAFRLQHEKANTKDYEWFREWCVAENAYYLAMHHKGMEIIRKNKMEEVKDDPEKKI